MFYLVCKECTATMKMEFDMSLHVSGDGPHVFETSSVFVDFIETHNAHQEENND